MLFQYKIVDQSGKEQSGQIEAGNRDQAVSSLQRRGFVVVKVDRADAPSGLRQSIPFFDKVPLKDIVIMSRQLATMFEAQVSAVRSFNLLAASTKNATLSRTMGDISSDVQGGISISEAMAKHPVVFSNFFVNMVRAGEESGKLTTTFMYLAEYLDRQHELISKTRNALIYPIFVILTFIVVMVLMLTLVIPKLSQILIETGQDLPIYTKAVIWLSDIFVKGWPFILAIFIVIGGYLLLASRSNTGKHQLDRAKISMPFFGDLYTKLYLSRIADNLETMIASGIRIVAALEITAAVVDNAVYEGILKSAAEEVKGGSSISAAFGKHKEMPAIMVQILEVGEETGATGKMLKMLAGFYKREVNGAVDTLIGLIEPAMIIALGLGVGFLLVSVLLPIYNIAGGF